MSAESNVSMVSTNILVEGESSSNVVGTCEAREDGVVGVKGEDTIQGAVFTYVHI